jgi:hypothetical protein
MSYSTCYKSYNRFSPYNSPNNNYIYIPISGSQLLARFDCISKSTAYYDMSAYITHSYNPSCCTLPDGQVLLTGCYRNIYQGDCYIFNPVSLVFIKVASLNRPRYSICLHYHAGYVYAFGGIYLDPVKSSERFSLIRNRWEVLPDLRMPRFSCTCVTIGDYIYVIGGRYVNSIEEFDTDRRRFRMIETTVLYKGCSCTYSEDRIYVICSEGYVILNRELEEIDRKMYRNKNIVFSRGDIRVYEGRMYFNYDNLIEEFDLESRTTVSITEV